MLPVLCFGIIVPLALIVAVLGIWKNPSRWRLFFPMLVYVLFVGAYCYIPGTNSNVDLVRYFPEIELYGEMSLSEAFSYADDVLYARDFLFWLCGHLHATHLVPAITTAAVYGVAGYISCDSAERCDAKCYIGGILLFQLMMLPYISIINNIRNVSGFSLIILAAYLDIVKQKKTIWVWLCYLCGATMHLSCFVLLVFRILSRLSKKLFEAVLLLPLVFSSLIYLLYDYSSAIAFGGAIGNSIQTVIRKLYKYLTNTNTTYAIKAQTSQIFILNRVTMMFGVILALILIYYGIRNRKKLFGEDLRFHAFLGMIASMTLASNVFAVPNYWRFAAAFYVAAGCLFVPLMKHRRQLTFPIRLTLDASLLLGPLGLFVQYWQARTYGYGQWAIRIVLTDYLTIAYDIIKGIITWG